MIKTRTCHTAACDVCGDEPEAGYGESTTHFEEADEALEQARINEWWATEAVVICCVIDAAHAARVQETAAHVAEIDFDGEAIADFRAWGEMTGHQVQAAPAPTAPFAGQVGTRQATTGTRRFPGDALSAPHDGPQL